MTPLMLQAIMNICFLYIYTMIYINKDSFEVVLSTDFFHLDNQTVAGHWLQ